MRDAENIANFFLRVDEIGNIMRGVGDKIEDAIIVEKILRSLTPKLNAKVSAIEQKGYEESYSKKNLMDLDSL